MESYGTILKQAREDKHIDIETASRETSITCEYVKGLEDEDISAFPGEPYMVGFLRNYSEYLGLDVNSIMSLYRSKAIQESPVPYGLLFKRRSSFFIPIIVSVSVLVVAIAVSLFFIFRYKANKNNTLVASKKEAPTIYELTDKPLNVRLFRGNQIMYSNDQEKIILTVSDTLTSFGLDTPIGTLYTDLSEEAELDINGDSSPDIIVYVSDISKTDAARGAEVRILMKRKDDLIPMEDIATDMIVAENDTKQTHPQRVIHEDNRAYPFTVNATFRAPCEFRYRIDRRRSEESYFTSGDVVTMTSNNGLRLWMSNSNAVKVTVIADTKSIDLEIGRAGQVLVQDIKWVRDNEGRYKLVVVELD